MGKEGYRPGKGRSQPVRVPLSLIPKIKKRALGEEVLSQTTTRLLKQVLKEEANPA
jgi:hypothetical protein